MQELLPNIHFQVGRGTLNIIVNEICERKEGTDRSQCDIYLSGFQIANLDESQNIIKGKVLDFKDEDAPKVARLLAMVLWDIAKGTMGVPVTLEDYSLTIDLANDNDISISRNNAEVIVPREDITELGGKLAVIVGSTPYRSI